MPRRSRPSSRKQRRGWLATTTWLTLLLPALAGMAAPQAMSPASAVNPGETRAELRQLRQRIENLRREVAQTRDHYDKARNKLRDVDLRISQHLRELNYIRHRLGRQDRRLKRLYQDQKRYQQDLQVQRQLLGRQLRTAYILGRQAYLKLLLNADDPAVTGRTLKYYDYFHRSRTDLIHRADTALARVEQNQRDIEREKQRLIELRQYNLKKKQQLETDAGQRRRLVAGLNRQLQGKTASLKHLLADEKQLQRLLDGIDRLMPDGLIMHQAGPPFRSLKGKLTWPASGTVERLFGRKRGASKVSWNGIIIRAKAGGEVHAVSRGRVAYADWLRGYGLLLIIDHGNGYMSLYGNNQSLYKETGDWVETGETIATIGNSGGHIETGLYFEIRYRGKPTNPVNWCRAARRS